MKSESYREVGKILLQSAGMTKAIIGAVILLRCGMCAQQRPLDRSPSTPFGWDYRKAEQVDHRHTINAANKLSSADRAALVDALAAQIGDIASDAHKPPREMAAEIPIKLVDLNGDGKPEITAQAGGPNGCSATGNCAFWVLQRGATGYSVLLESEAQTFRIQSRRTNIFRVIVLSRHSSAFESEVTEYKFNGASYVNNACYYLSFGTGDQTFKQPQVKPCNE